MTGPGLPDLVARSLRGDDDAFAALYREHAGRIFALCLRLEGDRAAAEELTQDVFVRAWRRLGTWRGESAFGTWLHRLAVNVVLEHRRSAWRRLRRVLPLAAPEELERPARAAPAGLAMDLEAAIARLPEGARTVLVLHDIEGYTHEEIGQMTGIAPGTSKAQLFRARRLLREALDR